MLITDHALDDPITIDGVQTTLRSAYAQQVNLRQRPVTEFATHFGVAIQVVTGDGLMLISDRGDTAVDAHVLFPSVAEGSSRPVDANDHQIPHPNRTAVRGIYEELAIDINADDIEWISFGANAVLCEYGLIGWIEIGLSFDDLLTRRQTGLPKDIWESDYLYGIPFNPHDSAEFVAKHGPWSPFGLVALYHTLLARFSWEEVSQAFKGITPMLSENIPVDV
jgi:hypothetical protein